MFDFASIIKMLAAMQTMASQAEWRPGQMDQYPNALKINPKEWVGRAPFGPPIAHGEAPFNVGRDLWDFLNSFTNYNDANPGQAGRFLPRAPMM